MPLTETKKTDISAFTLRVIAIVCMFCDHLGYCLAGAPVSLYLRIIGRPAFPIFVYLIVNGCRHTRSKPKYAMRLAIFAVLSQVPFALMLHGSKAGAKAILQGGFSVNALKYLIGGANALKGQAITGNVFVTLLLSLLCVWFAAELWKKGTWGKIAAFVPSILVCGLYYFGYIHSDYGMKGILLALVFYFFDGHVILTFLGSFAALFSPTLISYALRLMQLLRGRQAVFALPDAWTMKEAYALLALIPIYFYHGTKGYSPKNKVAAKALQIAFYAFYPVHMLLLWLIFR